MNKQLFVTLVAACLLITTHQQFAMNKKLKHSLKLYSNKSGKDAISSFERDLESGRRSPIIDLRNHDNTKTLTTKSNVGVILAARHGVATSVMQNALAAAASNAGC